MHQQFNADHIDLRNSTFERLPDNVAPAEVVRRLEAILREVERAASSGALDQRAGRSVADDLHAATRSLTRDDQAEASRRLRKAIEALQAAAPLAAIGGAMATIWNTLGGGS
ncbi:hypothetical protein DER29_2064 [Micromonospora sp. M71_S20]|nr:hypothetical protein DER29_2064 [Micromonospora sp. M71_S20]